MENLLLTILVLITILIIVVFASIILSRASGKEEWKNTVNYKLIRITGLASTEDTIKISQALLEADKLLDYSLKMKRIRGNSLGERLKGSRHLFDKNLYNQIWEAHKVRNKIVHEIDFAVSDSSLKINFQTLKKAIRTLTQ